MEVYGELLTFRASLKWPFEELQFVTFLCKRAKVQHKRHSERHTRHSLVISFIFKCHIYCIYTLFNSSEAAKCNCIQSYWSRRQRCLYFQLCINTHVLPRWIFAFAQQRRGIRWVWFFWTYKTLVIKSCSSFYLCVQKYLESNPTFIFKTCHQSVG